MSLTKQPGPLAGSLGDEVNFTIDGPAHRLFMHDFPRRVRARFAGETVLDTERGRLLHETGLLPVLYVPEEDVRTDLLEKTVHSTHCPFKGDAVYWTVRAGDRAAENAVWGYPEPKPEAAWLRGHMAFYWDRMDAWFDEDEEVKGHLRDPFHRVDARTTSRRVRVLLDGEVVAETGRPKLLSETGLPNRYYIPAEGVRRDLLTRSAKRTFCPYKGEATYWSLAGAEDAAWSYEEPLEDAAKIGGYLSFDHEAVTVESQPPLAS
ncbi:uncharacterized protein (DUF427 family) [Actinomadura luteofluorescens]|uniref:Uncharacterized protein (DUF427 family) n=2 Tax=Actinomadura luteofluorescens TaxID=46163 RepID=A0A7Y9EPH4_9ACTN|nr:DUF427 domain-containing protein [Actinomadura luteofluorescens]NYD51540.1 uncharacterized protein (DUF427 family) [Actinomadura luteofluorescens]